MHGVSVDSDQIVAFDCLVVPFLRSGGSWEGGGMKRKVKDVNLGKFFITLSKDED